MNQHNKLPITSCTVTNDPYNLLFYSILSLVDHIDEILIYDDSPYYFDYSIFKEYKHVKILKNKNLFNLGEKKQKLVDNAKNDIVLRWDDDFILYDKNVLQDCYHKLINENKDAILTYNYNLMFGFQFLKKEQPFVHEAYIYKKNTIQFKIANNYPDYPVFVVKNPKIATYKKCLFLHLNNFKSCEKLYFRNILCPFNLQKEHKNYYEWIMKQNGTRLYTFNNVIDFKRKSILYQQNIMYSTDFVTRTNEIDLSKIHKNLVEYVNTNYRMYFSPDNKKTFAYKTFDTAFCKYLFYWGGQNKKGNFGDLLSAFIFEKLTGIKPVFYNMSEEKNKYTHYISVGSIINYSNSNSIIWGSGTITEKLKKIDFHKVFCVRGPRTRKVLLQYYKDIPEKYGDPALLISLLYKPKNEKRYKIGIIPHIIDYEEVCEKFKNDNICVINLKIDNTHENIQKTIDEINSCDFIFSSSLHGIIVSNAYNISVIRFKKNKLAGDDIKFTDYFESVYSGEYNCNTNYDIDYCIDNFDEIKEYYSPPNMIKDRQKDLIETCPFFDKTLTDLLFKEQ